MKQIFLQILFVFILSALYFGFEPLRLPIGCACLFFITWIATVEFFLSPKKSLWLEEFSGKYHQLSPEQRLQQIRENFNEINEMEASKLRWFYLQFSIFQILLVIAFALIAIAVAALLFFATKSNANTLVAFYGVAEAILFLFLMYCMISTINPKASRMSIETVIWVLGSREWKARLFNAERNTKKENDYPAISDDGRNSFFHFWLDGQGIEERRENFLKFIGDLNRQSTNGLLFEIFDDEKVKVLPIVQANASAKSLIGFLKYCIREKKVLSEDIIRHKKRKLIQEIFVVDGFDPLVQLESGRFNSLHDDYLNVYKTK